MHAFGWIWKKRGLQEYVLFDMYMNEAKTGRARCQIGSKSQFDGDGIGV